MSLPQPLNWLRATRCVKFVVFGFNRSDALMGGWWAHSTPDHTQRFFYTLEEAENWVKENHGLRGFGRNNDGKARGELKTYLLPSPIANEKWMSDVELIQENFDYGELVKWYGSRYEYDEGKTTNDNAQWWIFRLN